MTPAEPDANLVTRRTSTAAAAGSWPLLDDLELGARVADLFTRVA